jgi:hypothetical protein
VDTTCSHPCRCKGTGCSFQATAELWIVKPGDGTVVCVCTAGITSFCAVMKSHRIGSVVSATKNEIMDSLWDGGLKLTSQKRENGLLSSLYCKWVVHPVAALIQYK